MSCHDLPWTSLSSLLPCPEELPPLFPSRQAFLFVYAPPSIIVLKFLHLIRKSELSLSNLLCFVCLCTAFHLRIENAQELRKISLSLSILLMHHLPLQNRIEIRFKRIMKILLSRYNVFVHHIIDIPQERRKLSLSLSNWKHHSCFLGMRWFLLTFAFFQDRSLLLSYFSTSLPWLSKSTWISIVCKQFQEKKNWHYLFCKFDATLLPRIVPWRTPKTDATAEKIKKFSKIVIKINNMQGSV